MVRHIRHLLSCCFGSPPSEDPREAFRLTFWRNAIGVFIALRLADMLNAVTGLWVIPSHLPSSLLGAVLPLLQVGAFLTIPLNIFASVFTRHLCAYAVANNGENARGLLRDSLMLTALCFALAFGVAVIAMPWICDLLRIPHTIAGYLAIGYSLLAAFTPMMWASLQALRRFGALASSALLSALIRLLSMSLLLPLIGLSGYFIGQSLSLLAILTLTFFVLRPLLKQSRATPLLAWRRDVRAMARYAFFIALGVLSAALHGVVLTFVIRHRLSDELSGAYYVISRFAEIATYSGTTLATVLFPFVVEARLKKIPTNGFRNGVMGLTLLIGGGLALALYGILPWLFTWIPGLTDYGTYAPTAAYLTLITTLNAASSLHFTHAAARDRFTYLRYSLPCTLLLTLALLFLPTHSLHTIFHILFTVAALQFFGCLIEVYYEQYSQRT